MNCWLAVYTIKLILNEENCMVVNGSNIDFLLAALFIEALTIAAYKAIFTTKTVTNNAFGYICYSTLFAIFSDLFYQFCKAIVSDTIYWVGIGRFVFNSSLAILALTYYYYSRVISIGKSIKDQGKILLDYIITGFSLILVVFSFANYFNHSMEPYYENGVKKYGFSFFVIFFVPCIIMSVGYVYQWIHRNHLTKKQMINSFLIGFVFNFVSVIEMVIHSQFLLSMFGLASSTALLLLTCETKDYASLLKSNVDLEESTLKAEMANRAKSDFLARMSHEIRTPMNAVLGMNEMIVNETEDPRIRSYAIDAYSAGRNLLLIINDILDFSKIESGKMELIEKPFDVKDLIRDEWVMFDIKAREKNLNLNFNIDTRIPRILLGDGGRLKQIITNILGNAVKYTMVGSVTLNIDLMANDNENATLKVSVIDTGRGIRKEDIGKLFEAFERIDEKENSAIEGTGLGINITAKLLKLMNSELMVESTEGKGSNFYFTVKLPIIETAEIGEFKEGEIENKADDIGTKQFLVASGAKVLVVDDNAINLKVFSSLIRNTQINISTAESGEEAIEMAHVERFDIIFLDHLMPGIDGVEALKEIKNDMSGLNLSTPIIALTANAIKGADEMYRGYGFDDVTFKPYTQDELYRCLFKYLPKKLIESGSM